MITKELNRNVSNERKAAAANLTNAAPLMTKNVKDIDDHASDDEEEDEDDDDDNKDAQAKEMSSAPQRV